jgi:Lon protease-like protein
MSEALDKVRGVRELPLFPLQAVLFPGMPMPLHIFEPRYRKMLADIRAGDNLFGLSYFDSAASENEIPAAGHIGCVAEVTETQALPDGRSNVLTVGVIRYRVEAYVERGDPYLVVRPNFFEDDDQDDASLLATRATSPRCSRAWRTQSGSLTTSAGIFRTSATLSHRNYRSW